MSKNEIQIFTNPEFGEIPTIKIDGEVYFIGLDVAKALEYKSIKATHRYRGLGETPTLYKRRNTTNKNHK